VALEGEYLMTPAEMLRRQEQALQGCRRCKLCEGRTHIVFGSGNPSAEHNLGFMYEKGYGVPRNPSLAASWYRKSADQGYPAGQLALGRLYFEGVGIQRDLVEAYKWMYLAGRGTAKAFQYINVIGNMLTYDQMSEAMRRGQMWEPVVHH